MMAVTSGPSPKNDDELLINFLLKFAANGSRILQNSENVEEQSNHLSNPRISLIEIKMEIGKLVGEV